MIQKSLIAISAYCPDIDRKKCLIDTLLKIQGLRSKYDILLVTHSTIEPIYCDLVDYSYFDANNEILTDFDLTNKFEFSTGGFKIKTSLVYPKSTHLAIYRLIYYVFNFAKFHNYQKVHYIEYDFDLENISMIDVVDDELGTHDSVMFKDLDSTNFVIGSYFAFTTKDLDSDFDRNKIIEDYKYCQCITELVTPMVLTKNNRSIKYLNTKQLNQDLYKISKIDSHDNSTLKWSIPVFNLSTQKLDFFIYNESGGEYSVELHVDDRPIKFGKIDFGCWYVQEIGEFESIQDLKIFINGNLRLDINFNESNRETFKQTNYLDSNLGY